MTAENDSRHRFRSFHLDCSFVAVFSIDLCAHTRTNICLFKLRKCHWVNTIRDARRALFVSRKINENSLWGKIYNYRILSEQRTLSGCSVCLWIVIFNRELMHDDSRAIIKSNWIHLRQIIFTPFLSFSLPISLFQCFLEPIRSPGIRISWWALCCNVQQFISNKM